MADDDSGGRRRNRQGEGGRLRGELIAAASRLLAEAGADDAVSLRAIAREVGVAAPSVYLHFRSRDDLLHAVREEHFEALRRAIDAATAQQTEPTAKLLAGCLAYCRFAADLPGPYRILFGPTRTPAGGAAPDGPAGDAAFATLVDAIGACMRAGVAPPADPFRVATDVWPGLHGLVSLRAALPDFPWPPLEEQVSSVVRGLTGIRIEEASHCEAAR